MEASDFSVKGAHPPRPPQQFSIRKAVSRFTLSSLAEYEMDRPFFFGSISSAAANTFR
jgi:hypothetical protein